MCAARWHGDAFAGESTRATAACGASSVRRAESTSEPFAFSLSVVVAPPGVGAHGTGSATTACAATAGAAKTGSATTGAATTGGGGVRSGAAIGVASAAGTSVTTVASSAGAGTACWNFVAAPRRRDAASTSADACTARLRRPPGRTVGSSTSTRAACCSSADPSASLGAGRARRPYAGTASDGGTRRRRRGFGSPSAPSAPAASASSFRLRWRSSLRSIEFQRFLIALSVRPGKHLTITDHRVPYRLTASWIARSSSAVHFAFVTCGLRWLCHRSRHCLPVRAPICSPMSDHRTLPPLPSSPPSRVISSRRRWSSSAVHTCFFHPAPVALPPSSGSGVVSALVGTSSGNAATWMMRPLASAATTGAESSGTGNSEVGSSDVGVGSRIEAASSRWSMASR